MRINLTRNGARVGVEISDAADLKSLSAHAARGVHRSAANASLDGVITWDAEEHLWVDQQWLRAAANCESAARAPEFDAMISYATRKGWVDPATGRVRVHLEPPEIGS
jgi:hypothetical protein